MKRFLLIITILFSTFILTSCQQKEEIDLKELDYYEYLSEDNPVMTISIKNYGKIEIQLFKEMAPATVANIIDYISLNLYANSSFHRIIEDFMIQGGIVNSNKQPIYGEFNSNGFNNPLSHTRGVISMARTTAPNSATSQFFIVHKDSTYLDGEYAAFGGMISGFDVLDKIATVDTNFMDAPISQIVIEKISIKLNGYYQMN